MPIYHMLDNLVTVNQHTLKDTIVHARSQSHEVINITIIKNNANWH